MLIYLFSSLRQNKVGQLRTIQFEKQVYLQTRSEMRDPVTYFLLIMQ